MEQKTMPAPSYPHSIHGMSRRATLRPTLSRIGSTCTDTIDASATMPACRITGMTRIVPGGQSSHRHAHSRQDEFIYVLEGEVTLETNAGQQILAAGMCAGFPAGTGDGHRFVNHSSADTVLL